MPKIDATVKITLRIPENLLAQYEARATLQKRSVEDLLVERLKQCAGHNDSQPIYLTDAERNALNLIASKQITSASDLLTWARSITSLHVAGVDVPLGEQLIKRLDSRRFGKTWKELMLALVPRKLEEEVGLR